MRRILFALLVAGWVLVSPVLADSFSIDLNDSVVRGLYLHEPEADGLAYGLDWLHHEDDGDVVSIPIHVVGVTDKPEGLRLGIGGKLLYVDARYADGGALGLGAHAHYRLQRAPLFGLEASLYVAPGVVTFGDADDYYEGTVRGVFRLIPRAHLFLGARRVRGRFEDDESATFDSALHGGLTLRF